MNGPTPAFDGQAPSLDYRTAPALRLNFRNAPLRAVLNYLHEATSLPIEVNSDVDIDLLIDFCSSEPVNKTGAIQLLNEALTKWGHTAVDKNGMLLIIRSHDAKKHRIPLPLVVLSA